MKIYNGENVAITVVTDGNADVVIEAKSFAEVNVSKDVEFNSDCFYIEEKGAWYAIDARHTDADLEIYSEWRTSWT